MQGGKELGMGLGESFDFNAIFMFLDYFFFVIFHQFFFHVVLSFSSVLGLYRSSRGVGDMPRGETETATPPP